MVSLPSFSIHIRQNISSSWSTKEGWFRINFDPESPLDHIVFLPLLLLKDKLKLHKSAIQACNVEDEEERAKTETV